jgi:hypothetical protein
MKLFHRLFLYRFSENNYQIKYEKHTLERFIILPIRPERCISNIFYATLD